jgi:nucleotide-binding universal stress UspA family protein
MKIKKLLVPVDFSDNSLNALKYAVSMERDPGAGIMILHVADPTSLENDLRGNTSPEHMYELLCKEDHMLGVKSKFIMEDGPVASTIINQAKTLDVDMVVMGTQGAGNFTKNIIGSNTSRVIGNTDCPVLAVPAESEFRPIRKVVLAVDLDKKEESTIIDVVGYLSKMNTSILITYVTEKNVEKSEHTLMKIGDLIRKKTGHEKLSCKVIDSDDFHESIGEYIEDINADLLVTITHHRDALESIFDPSRTKRIAIHSEVPIMAISQKRKPIIFFGIPL